MLTVVLLLLVSLLFPMALYYLVQQEKQSHERMDRTEAERVARQDIDEEQRWED